MAQKLFSELVFAKIKLIPRGKIPLEKYLYEF